MRQQDDVEASSFGAWVMGVFASPGRTFAAVARRPRFCAPFLAILTAVAGFWGVVYLKRGPAGMAVAVVQELRRGTLVPPDQLDFALQYSRALLPLVLTGAAAAILLHLLIVAWIGVRAADLLFSVKLRLRVALSLACYAYWAKAVVQTMLGIPMVLFGGADGLNFGNLLPTNIAFFLEPRDVSRTLYTFLQSLDLVQLWYFRLLGMGLAVESDDPAAPAAMAVSLAVLWIGWNVLCAAFRDLLFRP